MCLEFAFLRVRLRNGALVLDTDGRLGSDVFGALLAAWGVLVPRGSKDQLAPRNSRVDAFERADLRAEQRVFTAALAVISAGIGLQILGILVG